MPRLTLALSGALSATLLLGAPPAFAADHPASESVKIRRIPFNVSLIPPLDMASILDEPVIVGTSFNLIGGHTYGLETAEFGGVFNMEDGFVHGFQCAGVANWVSGPIQGAQVAGVVNWAKGPAAGAQIGGIANWCQGDLDGVQVSGIANWADGTVNGPQIAGVANWAIGDVHGPQVSGVLNQADHDVHGAQVGLVNLAGGKVSGVQVGLFNMADELEGVPIGLVSLVRKGRLEVQALYHQNGLTQLSLNSGGATAYSILSLLNQNANGGSRLGLQGGIGLNLDFGEGLYDQLELVGGSLSLVPNQWREMGSLVSLQESLGYRLLPHLAFKVGASLNALSSMSGSALPVAAFASQTLYASPTTIVWAGYFGALEF